MLQRLRYVHEITRIPIIDNYGSGKLALLFGVRPFADSNAIRRSLEVPISEARPALPFFIFEFNSVDTPLRQDGNKKPMFISNVEIVDGPNGLIPSIARFYRVEHKPIQIRGGNIYASLRHPSFKFFNGLADREFCPIIDKGWNQSLDSLQPGIVEGAIEIVDSIPEHQRNIVEGRSIAEIVYQEFVSCMRINVDSGSVSFVKFGDAEFDVLDVLLGPVNLESGVG